MARKRHVITKSSGEITQMVNESGGEKYSRITAVQRRETMLGYCCHATKKAGDGVVRGSGLCAKMRGLLLLLAL